MALSKQQYDEEGMFYVLSAMGFLRLSLGCEKVALLLCRMRLHSMPLKEV